jgi:hypothetical protein
LAFKSAGVVESSLLLFNTIKAAGPLLGRPRQAISEKLRSPSHGKTVP